MDINNRMNQLYSFIGSIIAIKILTKISHIKRSIALSAPRGWRTFIFKYLIMPCFISNYSYTIANIEALIEIRDNLNED